MKQCRYRHKFFQAVGWASLGVGVLAAAEALPRVPGAMRRELQITISPEAPEVPRFRVSPARAADEDYPEWVIGNMQHVLPRVLD